MKILVVDDDPPVRRAVSRLLRQMAEVFTAESAEDALAQLSAGLRVDVILSDYKMSGMTGVELIERLGELFSADAPRVVLMSGSSMHPELRRAVRDRGLPLISKPFKVSELMEALGL